MKVGITFRPNPGLALNFDIQNIWYGDTDSIANPVRNVYACPTAGVGGTDLSSCFGGNNGGGFGWEDMTIIKLGYQWMSGTDWTWRVGLSNGDQPIPDTETIFNIIAPAVVETHLTGGFTKKLGSNSELSAALLFVPYADVQGTSAFDPNQTIKLEMSQWEAEVSYGMKF